MNNENEVLKENKKEPKEKVKKAKEKKSTASKVSMIIGIVLCVILVPILILNTVLIIKGVGDDRKPPSIFGYVPLTVASPSMYPLFDEGDMIFIKEIDPDEIDIGDVICFFDPAQKGDVVLTHRVVDFVRDENGNIKLDENGNRQARTAGDLMINSLHQTALDNKTVEVLDKMEEKTDPNDDSYTYWYTSDPANYDLKPVTLDEENVIGVYAYSSVPFIGSISNFMSKPYGWVVCIGVPLLAFVLFEVISRRKSNKGKKQDMDALLAELEALKAAKAAAEQTEAKLEDVEPAESVEKTDAEVADATETADPPSEE